MFRKKIGKIKFATTLLLSTLVIGTTSLAVNPSFGFNLKNNGQRYTYDSGSKNSKVYVGQNWSLKINSIGFSSGTIGYGASFIPINSSLYKGGNAHWRTSSGISYGSYGSYGGAKGTYYIGCRLDDDINGSVSTSGLWNSDYVNF